MRDAFVKYFLENQIISAILLVAVAFLVVEIKEVLIAIFVSYILMSAISPYVDFLEKNRVPKIIAVVIPYLLALAFLFLILIALVPFFVSQVQVLFARFPSYLSENLQFLDVASLNTIVANELENIGRNVFSITNRVFGGVVSFVSIIAISFYLLLYKDTVRKSFANIFPQKERAKVLNALSQAEEKVGSWLRGQIFLSGFIGVITWIVLTLLGIEFALPLAVIAGLLEIVPTIGPTIAAVPAIIVAFSISPILVPLVALSYFLIQLFENNVLVPRVMQKAVGLNPIIVIIGIIVGGKLLGIAGALLAIPFISLAVVIYKNLE